MATELTSLLRLEKSQAKSAAGVLARAFQNYPLSKFYFPDNSSRSKVNQYICAIGSYIGIRFGEVYASSANLEGIAVWLPSEHYRMDFRSLLSAVPLSTLFGFGLSEGIRMRGMGEYIDKVHKRLAPFNHWYLSMLGVEPHLQGRGYAGKLLRPMLRRTDQEKLPCYLETNDETDVPIYQHFGFGIIEVSNIPETNLKNWAMLREVDAVFPEDSAGAS